MTDPVKRPLTFPKWHIPYLEKHRILELFHELARELLIQKPDDHILFMKQMIQQAASSRDAIRLILIGSKTINRAAIAENIAKDTRQIVITLDYIRHIFSMGYSIDASCLAKAIACLVKSQNASKSGWILADCINTEEEAQDLIKLGVLPTHVIHLVTAFQPKLDELLYCDVPEKWPELRRNLYGLKEVFGKKLKEVHLVDRTINQVASICLETCKRNKALKTVKPRVVLLGPRGSGRKTQARLLEKMLGLVHVDFEYILCQAWKSDSALGKELRACRKEVCMHSELLAQIVNKRILDKDCLENGWVLTGYPYTLTDFQFLDSLETPPNRVIALDSDLGAARERVSSLFKNAFTGSENHLPTIKAGDEEINSSERGSAVNETNKKMLKKHPKDQLDLINAENEFYCQNYGSIKKYCGDTLMVVNADQQERWVYECILGYIVGANPPGPPRMGFGREIPEVCSCECIKIPPKIAKTYTLQL